MVLHRWRMVGMKLRKGSGIQPSIAMLSDELVIVQMRIDSIHPINLCELSWAERFVLVEAAEAIEQTLAAQHFIQPGDAATEAVRSIEEGGIAIGDFDAEAEQLRRCIALRQCS